MTTITDPAPSPSTRPPRRSRPLRTTLLVIGSLALAYLAASGIAQAAYAIGSEDGSLHATVATPIHRVEIDTAKVDVRIAYDEVPETVVDFDQAGSLVRLAYEVDGDTLDVHTRHHRGPFWGFGGWGLADWGASAEALLTITLPRELAGAELDLDSTAGDLDVSGRFGAVSIESTAGNVSLTGAASDVDLTTTAGDIHVQNLAVSGSLRSDSTAGDTTFDLATLPRSIDIEAVAGDITAFLPPGEYRVRADATGGDVNANVASDPAAARSYTFEATAGDINLSGR